MSRKDISYYLGSATLKTSVLLNVELVLQSLASFWGGRALRNSREHSKAFLGYGTMTSNFSRETGSFTKQCQT